jgi:hypothetical protein
LFYIHFGGDFRSPKAIYKVSISNRKKQNKYTIRKQNLDDDDDNNINKKKLRGFSPLANYADRAIAAGQRS